MVKTVLKFKSKDDYLEFMQDGEKLHISTGSESIGRQNDYKFELEMSQLDDLLKFLLELQEKIF
jgi:hypothetical protein